MALREDEIAYVSLLSGYIVALQIKDSKRYAFINQLTNIISL